MSFHVGEALCGDGNEIAHIDLIIGDKSGPAGVAFANAIFLPIAKKYGTIAKEEAMSRTMIVEGVLSLYGGDSPHIVKQKLMSFFSDHGKEAKAA